MPDEKLAVKFVVIVDGREYHSAPGPPEPGQPISMEIEHRDNEASRLGLTVWEGLTDEPFPEFNTVPDPLCNPGVRVEAWAGWDGSQLYKVFAGLLVAKKAHYQPSTTEFFAVHDAYNLRKRAKVMTYTNITVGDLLRKLALEEGIKLTIDASAAGDEVLSMPTSYVYQLGEPNWALMLRYIHGLGYVTNTIREKEMVLKWNKAETGREILVERGDGQMKDFDIRQEQRKGNKRAPALRSHAHEPKPGKFWHRPEGNDCGQGKSRIIHTAPLAKKKKEHRIPTAKFSVKQVARRLEREGNMADIKLRWIPWMQNEEVIVLKGWGAQIDGPWETASVVHRLGRGPATTEAACWRKS